MNLNEIHSTWTFGHDKEEYSILHTGRGMSEEITEEIEGDMSIRPRSFIKKQDKI